jgi:GTP cyclohydrolase I
METNLEQKYPIATALRNYLETNKIPYFANHNILEAIESLGVFTQTNADVIRHDLIDELTRAFEEVLYCQVIDTDRDPNSMDTPRRLAKMYINELMEGRYYPEPKITAFPNDKPEPAEASSCESTPSESEIYHFNNLLVVQSPFISVCSHHHQPVSGVAYIGIIPGKKLIGLSKYTRLVQHIAQRGSLQEELTIDIANRLQEHTESKDIAVVTFAHHGCCENRGIRVHDSTTSAAEMRGLFMAQGKLREEFYDNVKMMRANGK